MLIGFYLIGFWIGDLELRAEKDEEKGVAQGNVGNGNGKEGEEFAAHKFIR